MEGRKDLFLLLIRITLGVVFIKAGYGKFVNFERTAAYFASIGIPVVSVSTALAAGAELLGGICLVLGLGLRLACLPLAFVMIVAVGTAHLAEVNTLVDLFKLHAWNYLMILLLLTSIGGGAYSLDAKFFDRT